jgi:hypothetical protein
MNIKDCIVFVTNYEVAATRRSCLTQTLSLWLKFLSVVFRRRGRKMRCCVVSPSNNEQINVVRNAEHGPFGVQTYPSDKPKVAGKIMKMTLLLGGMRSLRNSKRLESRS